jgi:hypothetical protein
MAEFEVLRRRLRDARARSQSAADEAFAARQRVKRIQGRQAALARVADPHDQHQAAELERLRAARARAEHVLQERLTEREDAAGDAATALVEFAALTDPREAIAEMSDGFPILLMPVRLETRFKTIQMAGAPQRRQLWVRIYPDDCSVDTFEATPTENEVANAKLYWTGIWEAGGIEDQERGAWRGLVGSHGSGRAEWIITNYRPVNVNQRPTKSLATDVILTIPTEKSLDDVAAAATAAFWVAVWLADGDKAKEDSARATFEGAVGALRAGEIAEAYVPTNLAAEPVPPLTRAQVNVNTAFVVFPPDADIETKRYSWSQAPTASLLPDHFVFLGYAGDEPPVIEIGNPVPSPLVVGPDPSAPPDQLLQRKDGDLSVPEDMRWMVEFDRAVEIGMGFKIDLNEIQANHGFDRVLVLGLRMSADEDDGKTELETLFQHHRFGRRGLSLVPQGTPTNNTEANGAGFTRADDADATFDDLKEDTLFDPASGWLDKKDGQWLAEYLGIDTAALAKVRHSGGSDQADARAMNVALWPATLGYWMETMMSPVFSPTAIEETRDFFNRFVSGRGAVPAIRIGSQPYGILPATAYSRMHWLQPTSELEGAAIAGGTPFLAILYAILRQLDADWKALVPMVSFAGKAGDPHRSLLDIIGLHPDSVEYAQRNAESVQELFNRLNLEGAGGLLGVAILAFLQTGMDLLRRLGYTGVEAPDMLDKLFFGSQHLLNGPLIDDRPLSESDPVRAYTTDGKNYLEWLVEAANTSLDALYSQKGFVDDTPPRALLYLMLRHALQLGYHDTSLRLFVGAGLLQSDGVRAAKHDAPFVHIAQQAQVSESRYRTLYTIEPAITGDTTMLVGDFIGDKLASLFEAAYLRNQVHAIEKLTNASTARLERAFADHVDCCTYRLDAWLMGLLHYQLAAMRDLIDGEERPATQGIYLGAYAWLEEVRPETKVMSPVDLDQELTEIFHPAEDAPLMRDSTNEGYIHAPSLNQAVAAAVLRNGYLSDASPDNRETLAVNLTSGRVRTALGILEGIRQGQSLGALLGYQFERGLHDHHNLAEVDQFIYKIRKEFPLRGDRLASTRTDSTVSIEALEARNVVDGLSLVEHIKASGIAAYPFGRPLPPATPLQASAINAEVNRLLDAQDAVADLALAEGVYQAVLGNYDRVAATYDAYSRGNFPPQPLVVQTPSSGIGLTHRVGLHLEAGADPATSPLPGLPMTPRAQAEPAVNRWLATVLPPLDQIGCKVSFRDAATNSLVERQVTMADLGVQPSDLLHLLRDESEQAMAELDDRIVRFTMATHSPRPDTPISVRYMEKTTASFSMFEIMPLTRNLRRLTQLSRPLRASDLALANEATEDTTGFVDRQHVAVVRAAMQTLRTNLGGFRTDLDSALAELDKRQSISLIGAAGGTFTLTFQGETTVLLAFDASAAELRSALEAIAAIGAGNVTATGGPLGVAPITVTFLGTVADLEELRLLADGSSLTPGGALVAATSVLVANADTYLQSLVDLLAGAAAFGIPQAGWGFAYDFARRMFTAVLAACAELADRWSERLTQFDALITAYNNLPAGTNDQEKFAFLQRAEPLISTAITVPLPTTPNAFRTALLTKRSAFADRRDRFAALQGTTRTSLALLMADVAALLPISAFDSAGFTLADEERDLITFTQDASAVAKAVVAELDRRLTAAQMRLAEHDAANQAEARVRALQAAAKALLGDDFVLVPEFELGPSQGDEIEKALTTSSGGTLLDYLVSTVGLDFPLDTWLYGVARVRPKMHAWEQLVMLTGSFGMPEPELTPLQLPFLPDDHWLALQFPSAANLDTERLLYTTHFATPFQKSSRQCGLLLDEWTELIPTDTATTGITFHYDRPNSEAPQTMLLVTPTEFVGGWRWADLVDAVNETLDLAKTRAVEPVHLDSTPYALFLPATVAAVTVNQLTISANLAVVNNVQEFMEKS